MDRGQGDAGGGTDDSRCPIRATHRRLTEAHLLWHQTLERYQQTAGFLPNVNATIQSLRNITFILQSERHSIPDFDEWYQQWRQALAADPIARWIVQARNIVVKQGELELDSTAVVRVLTWKDDVLIELPVPPGAPTALILKNLPLLELLQGSALPRGDLREAVLAIERRWSVPALEGRELLESLAH